MGSASPSHREEIEALRARVEELERQLGAQVEAARALERREQRFRLMVETIEDALYTHDLVGRFLTVNPAVTRVLDRDAEEIIGASISEFMLPEHRPAFFDQYLPQISERGSHSGVAKYARSDGVVRYIDYRNVLVREADAPYVIGTGRDITDAVKARREVRSLERQLQAAGKIRPGQA